jgi:hypothetical protein
MDGQKLMEKQNQGRIESPWRKGMRLELGIGRGFFLCLGYGQGAGRWRVYFKEGQDLDDKGGKQHVVVGTLHVGEMLEAEKIFET